MKIYDTVNEYLQEFKVGDRIVLGGRGIIDGLAILYSKHDTYKVVSGTTTKEILLRKYRGRTNLTLGANYYNQKIAVLSPEEYKDLEVLF